MSTSDDNMKVSDDEARQWMDALTPEDKAELKRQSLLKRAIELTQPEKAPDFASMSSVEFDREATKLFAEYERNRAKSGG